MSDKFSLYSVMRGTSSVTYRDMSDALYKSRESTLIDQSIIDALLTPSPTGTIKNLEQSFFDTFKRQLTVRTKRVQDVDVFVHDVSVHFASDGNLSEQVLSFRLPFDERGLPMMPRNIPHAFTPSEDLIFNAINEASSHINSTVLQDFWLSAHVRAGARKLRIAPNLVWCITEESQQVNAEILSVFKSLKIWSGRLDQPIVGAFELFALAEEKLSNAKKRLSDKKRTRQSTIHQEKLELGELAETLSQIKGMLGEFGEELNSMINDAVQAWDSLDSASQSAPKPTPTPAPIYQLTIDGENLLAQVTSDTPLFPILAPFQNGDDGQNIDPNLLQELLNNKLIERQET